MDTEDNFNDADSDMSICSNPVFSPVTHQATHATSAYCKVNLIDNNLLVIHQTLL